MQVTILQSPFKFLMIAASLLVLPACAPGVPTASLDVPAAFETSGVVKVAPYTRTIFNTNNF